MFVILLVNFYDCKYGVPCQEAPPQCCHSPCGPPSASTPMAATKVGTTKGNIKARNSQLRPANSSRASTQAMGKPNNKTSTQVMQA